MLSICSGFVRRLTNEQLCYFHKEVAQPANMAKPHSKSSLLSRLTCFQEIRERDADQQLLQYGPAQKTNPGEGNN